MIDTSNEVVRWLADQSMHDAAMAEVSASAVTDIEQKDKLRSDSASHRQRAATLLALMAERNEVESVITVWRGHTQRAEAERDRLREALLMWLDADDAGDGQECINAIAHARSVVGENRA